MSTFLFLILLGFDLEGALPRRGPAWVGKSSQLPVLITNEYMIAPFGPNHKTIRRLFISSMRSLSPRVPFPVLRLPGCHPVAIPFPPKGRTLQVPCILRFILPLRALPFELERDLVSQSWHLELPVIGMGQVDGCQRIVARHPVLHR